MPKCKDKRGRPIDWCVGFSRPEWKEGLEHICPQCGTKWKAVMTASGRRWTKMANLTPQMYYIQTKGFVGNCIIWWKLEGYGYTCNLDKAWLVTEEKAKKFCNDRKGQDIMWPKEQVDLLAVRHVDSEDLKK